MNATMQEYNAAAAAVPEEALLGSLVWYTISDVDINYEDAHQELKTRGLDTSMLRSIRPVDAYRLATKELEHSFPARDGVKLNIMVRSVGHDPDTAYRQIVCERVSTKAGERRRLIYDPSADLIYHRGQRDAENKVCGDKVEVIHRMPPTLAKEMTPEQQTWLTERLDALPERFRHLKTHLGSHKVRNFVRGYLGTLGAVAVRESGGVYFIPQTRNADLERLGDWIHSIGSAFHGTPLLDLMNQREMLAQAFEEEAIKEVEQLTKQIDEILDDANRRVRESTFDDYALRAAELTAKAKDYADMLDIRSEIAHKHIDKFKKKAIELVDRIDYKDK